MKSEFKFTLEMLNDVLCKAIEAANAAGDEWMAKAEPRYVVTDGSSISGVMLDVCGNAHVRFYDKRKKWFKEFDKAGFVSTADVLAIPHKFKYRQEYGLQMACAEAAANSLREQGVTGIRIWSYID